MNSLTSQVEALALEYGWRPESGNSAILHVEVVMSTMAMELAAVDRVLGMDGESQTRTAGARASRIRLAMTELDNHRRAARAVREML